MKVRLLSTVSGYQKELFDIVEIFLGPVEKTEDPNGPSDLNIHMSEHADGGLRVCAVRLSGLYTVECVNKTAMTKGALEEKRLHKRQQKLVLYDALVQSSGQRPPWGSLTGIRPTRLVYDAMNDGASLNDAIKKVRDTFHLTQEKARLLFEIITVQQSLKPADGNEIACYIGIPFCLSRCRYCSFLSREAGDGSLLPEYTQALMREIRGTIALMGSRCLRVRSVYIGGGTPTVLSESLLEQVLAAANPIFAQADEVTVEAGRPDTITPGKLRVMKDSGVQRISVNPQTMHDRTLELVGRGHTAQQTVAAFNLARETGFSHINTDLIAGLPGETLPMFDSTLRQVLSMQPESITVHTLSVKRSSDMYRYGDKLPEGGEVEKMVNLAHGQLGLHHYQPYYLYRQKHMAGNLENVGYAKQGYACLYNIDMMEDQTTVLAMGAGAASKRVWPGRKRVLRAVNVKDTDHYITRVDEMLERKNALFEGIGKGVKAPAAEDDSNED